MDEITHLIAQAEALLVKVAHVALIGVDDQTVCTIAVQVEKLGRLVDALRATSAAEIADRSRHELGSEGLSYRLGHRRPVHLIEQLTRVSQAEAARRIRLGSAVRPRLALDGRQLPAAFPIGAEALTAGCWGWMLRRASSAASARPPSGTPTWTTSMRRSNPSSTPRRSSPPTSSASTRGCGGRRSIPTAPSRGRRRFARDGASRSAARWTG